LGYRNARASSEDSTYGGARRYANVKILAQHIPKHHLIKGTGILSSFMIDLLDKATELNCELLTVVATSLS
jgi:hypothetical protein